MSDARFVGRPGAATGLRTAAVWSVLERTVQARADRLGRSLEIVDVGGGSGGFAVPLAEAGHRVTVVDPSPDALASLRRRAAEVGVGDRVRALQGDADGLGALLGPASVDLVCCHGTLEHVDDPASTLAQLAAVLAPEGALSLVTTNRLAAVLGRALAGAFDQARVALTSPDGRWGEGDPVPRRFDRDALLGLVVAAGLTVREVHPVRLLSDLVSATTVDSETDRSALLALEEAAAAHPGLAALGTAVHVVADRG